MDQFYYFVNQTRHGKLNTKPNYKSKPKIRITISIFLTSKIFGVKNQMNTKKYNLDLKLF